VVKKLSTFSQCPGPVLKVLDGRELNDTVTRYEQEVFLDNEFLEGMCWGGGGFSIYIKAKAV